MMGTLTTPTTANTAHARSARLGSSIAECNAMNPAYRKSRISVEVVRASQIHQVPQAGLPHNEPVIRATKVNMAPVVASDEAIIDEMRVLNAHPIAAYAAMRMYKNIPIQAAGTSMNRTR